MKRSKDLSLENLCLIEISRETFENYGYKKDKVSCMGIIVGEEEIKLSISLEKKSPFKDDKIVKDLYEKVVAEIVELLKKKEL